MIVYVYAFLDSLFIVLLHLHLNLHFPRLCLGINSILADQLLAHLLVQSAGSVGLDHIQVNLVSQKLLYQIQMVVIYEQSFQCKPTASSGR